MIQISLKPITEQNRDECISLKPRQDQMEFVASNLDSLEKAVEEPSTGAFGIYNEDTMVGFTLFDVTPYEDDDCFWIVRFMIDEQHQGRGLGKAALGEIITTMSHIEGCTRIRTSHVPDNQVVNKLYKSYGFQETGDLVDGEIVLDLVIGQTA